MRLPSPRLRFNPSAEVYLNRTQKKTREVLRSKIKRGEYVFEERDCIGCGGRDFEQVAEKDRYGLEISTVLCRGCGLLQSNPMMRKQDYDDFYAHHYRKLYVGQSVPTEIFFNDQKRRGQLIHDWVMTRTHLPRGANVIEVGCGAGGILSTFHDSGFNVIGFDFDEDYLNYGREQGLDLRLGGLSRIEPDFKADLIIYSHVFEHILDIQEELKTIESVLKPSGYLYIEVPGVYSIPTNYQGNFLKYLQNAHLYHFTLETLKRVTAQQGYKLIDGDEEVRALFKLGEMDTPLRFNNSFSETMD